MPIAGLGLEVKYMPMMDIPANDGVCLPEGVCILGVVGIVLMVWVFRSWLFGRVGNSQD